MCVSYTYSPMAASSGDPIASEDECIFGCDTDGSDAIIGDRSDSIDGGAATGATATGATATAMPLWTLLVLMWLLTTMRRFSFPLHIYVDIYR